MTELCQDARFACIPLRLWAIPEVIPLKKNGENDRKPAEISETESPPEVGLILPEDQGILALEFVDIGNNIFRSVKLYDRKSFSENLELINDRNGNS